MTKNQNLLDKYNTLLDKGIDSGKPKFVSGAIKKYKKYISKKYLMAGRNIYYELVLEDFINMSI